MQKNIFQDTVGASLAFFPGFPRFRSVKDGKGEIRTMPTMNRQTCSQLIWYSQIRHRKGTWQRAVIEGKKGSGTTMRPLVVVEDEDVVVLMVRYRQSDHPTLCRLHGRRGCIYILLAVLHSCLDSQKQRSLLWYPCLWGSCRTTTLIAWPLALPSTVRSVFFCSPASGPSASRFCPPDSRSRPSI